MSRAKPAVVRFYLDADVLGLAHVVAGLRSDATYPGDPGAVIKRRERSARPIADPATKDDMWIPQVASLGWLIVTRDSRIQQHRAEIEAVKGSNARMVALAGDELPGFDGLYFHPKHDLIVSASTQPLEEYVEGLVQQYFQPFEDPANSLPVDEGEYVWVVTEWETEEAVEEFFPELQESIKTQLVDYLNGISWSWVRSDEVASIYE